MKTLISSPQSGILKLEKEFLLGDNFFSISFDLSIENNSNYFLSLVNPDNSLGFIWSNNNTNLTSPLSIIESELLLNKWNSIKLIYIPSIGILYYKNKILINTFNIEINQNFYILKLSINENTKIRNLIINPINNSDKLLLHCNDSILNPNIWNVKGYVSSETSNNSHFGKSLKLFFDSELSLNQINSSGIPIDDSDFTFDFYIKASSFGSLTINLFSKYKRKINNLINLEFSNKILSSLILKDKKYNLNISISNISHFALVYHHKLSLIYIFINGILHSSYEFSLNKKNNYFLNILSQGIFNLDELHFCSGLAFWINNFSLPKYPYKNSPSIGNLFIPNPIYNNFIANSSIKYDIISNLSIMSESNHSVLIETLWKSNQFPSGEFIPFSKNIYQITPENYFSHKSDLIKSAESSIKACQLYLNSLIGVVNLPNNISEIYLNKNNKSIEIFVNFNRKIISQSIQLIESKISYNLDNKIIEFKELNFKITSQNYKNYLSELLDLVNKELNICKSYLDSISNKVLCLNKRNFSLINNNSILHLNSVHNNLKNLRLNLQENSI